MRMFLTLVLIVMSSAFVMAKETYGIKIAGEYITGYNRYDLTEINGVSGKVYFDPNTRPSPSTTPLLRQMAVTPS